MSAKKDEVVKKGSKVLIGDEELPLSEDMTIEELLEALSEDPAYANITEDNCFINEDGDIQIGDPKARPLGI